MSVETYVIVPQDERELYLQEIIKPWRCGTLRKINSQFSELSDDGVERKGKQSGPICAVTGYIDSPIHLKGSQAVIGWDAGRKVVTDYHWDDLPILGYAKDHGGILTLHKEIDNTLVPMTIKEATELGYIDDLQNPIRQGQPKVQEVLSDPTRLYTTDIFEWDVKFDNGKQGKVYISAPEGNVLPEDNDLIGKKQRQISNLKLSQEETNNPKF